MIIVRLRGGLGNQLFQFAAGFYLANKLNTELKLDLYTYTKHTYRSFELDKFQIPYTIASRKEVHKFTGWNPFLRYFNKRTNYRHTKKVYSQPEYAFTEDFNHIESPIYISGYWQSEHFFKSFSEKIREYYVPKAPPSKANKALMTHMQSENSVSVHIRRGDYASNTNYNNFFGVLDKEYYQNSILQIQNEVQNPVFYFFSDSIEWCKEEFSDLKNVFFVENNSGKDAFWDMVLMSHCKHNIIANSTFSWWGAWLNNNINKIVIAPKKWFQKDYDDRKKISYLSRVYNTEYLIPESWRRI